MRGLDCLLIMDSVTRLCHAQRQIGLAAGEPPATRGYPPSVFSMLSSLLERSGRTSKGSMTGFYAVLIEGDDLTDPIPDAVRGILDGHIQLSHELVQKGHWPAINVLDSISRVANDVTSPDHQSARAQVLRSIHAYQQVEELLTVGAYAAGSNRDFDLAIAVKPMIDKLLQQGPSEVSGAADSRKTMEQLMVLAAQIQSVAGQLATGASRQPPGPGR